MTIPFNEHTSVNTVKVIIYLPDRDRFGFPVDSDYWFANFARFFVSIAGGATILPTAQGVWLEDDLLISETVQMVSCFMPPSVLQEHAPALYLPVQDFALKANQSTVGVEIGGVFYIVPALSKEKQLC